MSVICDGPAYFVLYGSDLQSGVAGFGKTPWAVLVAASLNFQSLSLNYGVALKHQLQPGRQPHSIYRYEKESNRLWRPKGYL
jgi:hypothetical protein